MAANLTGQKIEAHRKVRFRDLSVTDVHQKSELLQAVDKVLTHGMLVLGPEVERFERKIAEYCGTHYCVGIGSGSDAIYLALRSYDIGLGDEVITTPLSWIATLNAIHLCGARPVFVDICEDLNIDADLIEAAITPSTRAIIPVHFTGRLCDMEKICSVAKKHDLLVVEDAAQAFGASRRGRLAGTFGHAGSFSMNPMKVFPAYGDAGAVVTEDKEVYEKLLALRHAGTVDKETCRYPALNSRIDTIQAAMMLAGFEHFETNIGCRLRIAGYYSENLSCSVSCPSMPLDLDDYETIFFDYTILAERRDELRAFLEEKGIETKIKHPVLMPDQPAYAHLERGELPVADRKVSQILCLPIHEKLTDQDIEYVADGVNAFYADA